MSNNRDVTGMSCMSFAFSKNYIRLQPVELSHLVLSFWRVAKYIVTDSLWATHASNAVTSHLSIPCTFPPACFLDSRF